MKFTIKNKDLKAVLPTLRVAAREQLDMWNTDTVRIVAQNGLRLCAGTPDLIILADIPADVATPGQALIEYDMLRIGVPGETLTVESNGRLLCITGQTKLAVPLCNDNSVSPRNLDVPYSPKMRVSMPSLTHVVNAVSKDDSKTLYKTLRNVLADGHDVVGADNHILGLAKTQGDALPRTLWPAIFAKALNTLLPAQVGFDIDHATRAFVQKNDIRYTFITTNVDGNYPNYAVLLPRASAYSIENLDLKQLYDIAKKTDDGIVVTPGENELSLSSEETGVEFCTMPATISGDLRFAFGLSLAVLRKTIHCAPRYVNVALLAQDCPLVLSWADDAKMLVMPRLPPKLEVARAKEEAAYRAKALAAS